MLCQTFWLLAVWCGRPAKRNRRLRRNIEQKATKDSKKIVLRRSGLYRQFLRAAVHRGCRSYGASPQFFRQADSQEIVPTDQTVPYRTPITNHFSSLTGPPPVPDTQPGPTLHSAALPPDRRNSRRHRTHWDDDCRTDQHRRTELHYLPRWLAGSN